jgi:SAM-dependent methyltransferase
MSKASEVLNLGTRQIQKIDLDFVVNYWKNLAEPDRNRMGCIDDMARVAQKMAGALETQIENLQLNSHASGDCEIWLANGRPIGFATLKNLREGRIADIHLHIVESEYRGKGIGRFLFCKSAVTFYERWHLSRLLCEPRSENPLPNRMLEKAFFPKIGSRFGSSSALSKEVNLNTYLIRYDIAKSWIFESTNDLPYESSAAENGPAILTELLKRTDQGTRVLELGSRSGQHAHLFTRTMPQLLWQPSELNEELLNGSRILFKQRNNNRQILPPLVLDLNNDKWGNDLSQCYDMIYASNVLHMISNQAVENAFKGARQCLKKEGTLWFYGPFKFSGKYTADSNKRFDEHVQTWNPPHSGLKDLDALLVHAQEFGFHLKETVSMPVNNHILIFARR